MQQSRQEFSFGDFVVSVDIQKFVDFADLVISDFDEGF